jgi:hypothetical protein
MADLTAKVKAAISGQSRRSRRQLRHAARTGESALARTQGQLATANAAFDKAMAVKKAFMLEKERKTREALDAIRDYPPRPVAEERSPIPWSSSKSPASARRTTKWSAKSKR